MAIRKRTSDVMLRKREKFGRKAVTAVACPIVNGGFETGDFTGWVTSCYRFTCTDTVTHNGAPEGTYYANLFTYNPQFSSEVGENKLKQTINCNPHSQKWHFRYRSGGTSGVGHTSMKAWIAGELFPCGFVNLSYPVGWTEVDYTLPGECNYTTVWFWFSITQIESKKNAWLDIDDVYFHV